MKKNHFPLILTIWSCLLFLTACGTDIASSDALLSVSPGTENTDILPAAPETTASETSPETVSEPVFEEYDITLMALGDNLIHMGVVYTGKQADGSLNYDFLYEGISGFLENADIKIINQETILGGNELGFSGFPYFNSPTEVGDAIAGAGFNVVLHASNHAADQGITGLENCAGFWESHPEVVMTGIHADISECNDIPLLTVGDITFAILNYTYGPNSETLSASIRGHLNMLCAYDANTGRIDFTTLNPQVTTDIKAAKKTADIVIVCPHWGTEYTFKPSSYQQAFARQMTEAGADLIIGTHPHVIQPIEWIESENGNRALCYYSLGNYVSTQKNTSSMLEAMAWVTFHVTEDGIGISDKNTGVIPLVCHYTSGPVRIKGIYPLEDYTEELAASHGIHSYGGVALHLSDLQDWSNELLGDWVLPVGQVLGKENP